MNRFNIGNNILRLRHQKKITQQELANFIGVTKASVSKWENNQSLPDITLLPQIATFFDITIDDLIGYIPQLSKEQIQTLYQKFTKDFAELPFEEVMKETREYLKRYYSCYPFLSQIAILWLNHYQLQPNQEKQKDICLEIEQLCQHIKKNCNNIKILRKATIIQAILSFQMGKIQQVVADLEEFCICDSLNNQSNILLAQSYAALGETEKAKQYIQVNMYLNLMNLLANATGYLWLHTQNLAVCEETIQRITTIIEEYKILQLNPNALACFEYQVAICYLTHNKKQQALGHIQKYVLSLSKLFSTSDFSLHGDIYFNKIQDWFEDTLEIGTTVPRNRKIVLEDAKKTLDVPPFTMLNGIPEFETIKSKLKGFS